MTIPSKWYAKINPLSSENAIARRCPLKIFQNYIQSEAKLSFRSPKGRLKLKVREPRLMLPFPDAFLSLCPIQAPWVSRAKIEDKKERSRLKKILRGLTLPEEMGLSFALLAKARKTDISFATSIFC